MCSVENTIDFPQYLFGFCFLIDLVLDGPPNKIDVITQLTALKPDEKLFRAHDIVKFQLRQLPDNLNKITQRRCIFEGLSQHLLQFFT